MWWGDSKHRDCSGAEFPQGPYMSRLEYRTTVWMRCDDERPLRRNTMCSQTISFVSRSPFNTQRPVSSLVCLHRCCSVPTGVRRLPRRSASGLLYRSRYGARAREHWTPPKPSHGPDAFTRDDQRGGKCFVTRERPRCFHVGLKTFARSFTIRLRSATR